MLIQVSGSTGLFLPLACMWSLSPQQHQHLLATSIQHWLCCRSLEYPLNPILCVTISLLIALLPQTKLAQ